MKKQWLINGPNGLSQLRPEYASFMPLLTHNRSAIVQLGSDNRSIAVRKSSHNRIIRSPKSFHRFEAIADILTESAVTNLPMFCRNLPIHHNGGVMINPSLIYHQKAGVYHLSGNRQLRALRKLRGEMSRGEIHHEEREGHEEDVDPIPQILRVLRGEKCCLRSDTF